MFAPLIGNRAAADCLKTLSSTTLLHGPDGVGKGHFAENAARVLLHTTKSEPPDLHIYRPEGKTLHHPVETIRQMIAEVSLPPFEAPCKAFIIHDAEKMLPASSNTLLKTLEEPPADTYFFLLSSQPDMVLPTIVSRCRKIPFFPIPEDEIVEFLLEQHKVLLDVAKKAAFLSDGSIARALTLIQGRPSVDALLTAKNYADLQHALSHLEEDQDADIFFEEILFWMREHRPFELEKTISLIAEGRIALAHHVKLKNVVEQIVMRSLL